jgi:acetyl-CoA C-acetyltransferase
MNDIYIYDIVRSARSKGKAGAPLSHIKPVALLAQLYAGLESRGLHMDLIEDVVIGCVTQVRDQGTNVAKVSTLYAGLPERIPGISINRLCTSGLDSVSMAAGQLASGMGGELMLAGGVESMSRVPIFSDKGSWFADPEVAARTRFVQMGFAADVVATRRQMSREDLDQWAVTSHQRAALAREKGYFTRSIIPITGDELEAPFEQEQLIRPGTNLEALAEMQPLFADKTSSKAALARYPKLDAITAFHHRGNSPALADGAAVAALGTKQAGGDSGMTPRARIVSWATASVEPIEMLTGSIPAAQEALRRAGMTMAQMDLVEVNEAFAAPTLAFIRELEYDPELVNVNGGTIAMGHAMGATGTILLAGLLDELERRDLKRGLVALAGGAGVASAMIIERV